MPLSSPRFRGNPQCEAAANNTPMLRLGASGTGVAAIQQALIESGFPMPLTTRKLGSPDGKFGQETATAVRGFQQRNGLGPDAIIGRNTMTALDRKFPTAPPAPTGLPYMVPGFRVAIAQPTPNVCWATVHCMMRSWKQQQSLDIREAAAAVDEKYGVMVDNDQGLPAPEFGPFILKARMGLEPMMNLTIPGWLALLKRYGLLWVGTLNSIGPDAGLHSRIVEGIAGDGTPDGTLMQIMDPDRGQRYPESFRFFQQKYEGAIIAVTGDYFQIRHFL